jgi:KUP system potassium uptake protein
MGHFGLKPIRLGWIALVAPSLVLCYLGQAAVVLADPAKAKDPFYSLSPNPTFTFFLVILATLATVIASQALITGVFSLSRQAVQLGLLPRMTIRHTNEELEGQIYVPLANWMLGIASIALVIGFGSSSALAAAYVLAIAGTMAVTTIAFYAVATYVWGWSRARVVPLTVLFLVIDLSFVASTATKLLDGGWVPVALALIILMLMLVWRRGHRVLAAFVAKSDITWPLVLDALERKEYARTPGEAMMLASHPDQVPTALASTIRLIHAVPEQVTVVTVNTLSIPFADPENRLTVTELGFGVRKVTADVGFAESPALPALLAPLGEEPASRVYYLSDRVFVASDDGEMGRFSESVFAFMHRNAVRPAPFFGLPQDRVVTLTSHVDL